MFFTEGLNVPEELLQSHEEGRLVFFCGAGVSKESAALPLFGELVEEIFSRLKTHFEANERLVWKSGEYDRVLNSLEYRWGADKVRTALSSILGETKRDAQYELHKAILNLSRQKNGEIRLVTTNYDRCFHRANKSISKRSFAAPLLPVPKASRWNGVVFLHGLLPESSADIGGLRNLVLTSSDFGRAYFTERWATRFVAELFRNFDVCFVGYSLNDTVMRYITEAFLADRMAGENTNKVWSFSPKEVSVSYTKAKWKEKGVTAIAYEAPNHDHSLLTKSLTEWSRLYQKEKSVRKALLAQLLKKTPAQIGHSSLLLRQFQWAILDPDGAPAQLFLSSKATRSLAWLPLLQGDCTRLVSDGREGDSTSLLAIPSKIQSYSRLTGDSIQPLDVVHQFLAKWLTQFVANKDFFLWCLKRELHPDLVDLIKSAVYTQLMVGGTGCRKRELASYWKLLFLGRAVQSPYGGDEQKEEEWLDAFSREGWSWTTMNQLKELCTPKICVRKKKDNVARGEPIFQAEVVFSIRDNGIKEALEGACLKKNEALQLLRVVGQCLGEALALQKSLRLTDWVSEELPSIEEHKRNRLATSQARVAELLRVGLDQVHAAAPQEAAEIVCDRMKRAPGIDVFSRIALYAAGHYPEIACKQWIRWLASGNGRILKSYLCRRELCRLFLYRGKDLTGSEAKEVKRLIAQYAPCGLNSLADLYLQRLEQSLNGEQNVGDRFEFSIFSAPDEERQATTANSLAVSVGEKAWCELLADSHRFHDCMRQWHDCCCNDFHKALEVLQKAQSQPYAVTLWDSALSIWARPDRGLWLWKDHGRLIDKISREVIEGCCVSFGAWLEAVASSGNVRDADRLLGFNERLLNAIKKKETNPLLGSLDTPLQHAENEPSQKAAYVAVSVFVGGQGKTSVLVAGRAKKQMQTICRSAKKQFQAGRIEIGCWTAELNVTDSDWTRKVVFPLFHWEKSSEASFMWQAFFSGAGDEAARHVVENLKEDWKETVERFDEFSFSSESYVSHLLDLTLWRVQVSESEGTGEGKKQKEIGKEDLQHIWDALPAKALSCAIPPLLSKFKTQKNRKEFIKNQLIPFWDNYWPRQQQKITPELSRGLLKLAVASGNEFPRVVQLVYDWITPIRLGCQELRSLKDSQLCQKYPKEAEKLLKALVGSQSLPKEGAIVDCFRQIGSARPKPKADRKKAVSSKKRQTK